MSLERHDLIGFILFHITLYFLVQHFLPTDCIMTSRSVFRFMSIIYGTFLLGSLYLWRGIRVIQTRTYLIHSAYTSFQTIYRSLFAPLDAGLPVMKGRDAIIRGILFVLFGLAILSNFYLLTQWFRSLACEESPRYLEEYQTYPTEHLWFP